MTDRQHRDAITGQYVTAEDAAANPDTTVSESPCAECERLRGVIRELKFAIDCYREELERLAGMVGAVRALAEGATYHGDPDDVGVYPLIRSQFAAEALAVLDLHQIVRTVGDLTARHRGKRVRVKASISDSRPACRGQWIIGTLDEIFIEVGELGLNLDAASIEGADHGDDLWCPYLAYGTDELATPCEVLP